MSQLIITTDVSSIRPVFSEGTTENIKRYNQFKKLFEQTKEYRIFAEPVPGGGQKIAWHTEYEGKIIPFRKLDEEEQEKAKGLLKSEVNELYKRVIEIVDDAKTQKSLFELIDSLIEIPDYDDIYLIQNANGQKNFCIVRWGFVNEDFKSPKNLISRLIPLKVASVCVKAIKGNNKIASNEQIYFEYNDKKEIFTTDDKGKIYLEDIKLLTKITAYQLDDDKRVHEQEFLVKNDDLITFYIGNQSLPKQEVSVQTMDENDNISSNVTIQVMYDDVNFTTDTNHQGIFRLGELFVGTEVTCHQIKNKQIVKSSTFNVKQGKSIYFVSVMKHKSKGNVKVRVIDEKNNIIPFAQIQVTFPDQTKRYFESDEEGMFEIEDMPFKENIVFRQIIDKLPQYQQIIRFTEEKKVFDFKGKIVKTPLDYTMLTINVIDNHNQPIPNLKVVVENGLNSYNQITDPEGKVKWDKIDCTKKTIITVENKGKKKVEEIKCNSQETNHTVKFSKKGGLWWLWILIILALLAIGGLLYMNFSNNSSTPDNPVVVDTVQNDANKPDAVVEKETYKGMKITLVDENDKTVANAKVNLTVNDEVTEKTSNDKGEVIFENLTDTSLFATAIITAPNFTKQRLTFRITKDKVIKMLPVSVEISEKILPCGTQIESKGYHSTIQTFNMKKSKGKFKLLYDMFDIADKIIVYKGKATDISDDNIIWQSKGFEKKLHTRYIDLQADSLITVEIQGGDTTKTQWYFKVYCPK